MKSDQSDVKQRLEYLRHELRAERISYGELVELQSLAEYRGQTKQFSSSRSRLIFYSWCNPAQRGINHKGASQ